MCITTEVKLVKKMLFLCATLVENLQWFILILFTRRSWGRIWKVPPLPHSRRQKQKRCEKETCVLCEEIMKKFEYEKKNQQKSHSAQTNALFFFSPVRAHWLIVKLINEVPALITEWFLCKPEWHTTPSPIATCLRAGTMWFFKH